MKDGEKMTYREFILKEIERDNGEGLTQEEEQEMVNDCCPSEFDYCPHLEKNGSQCTENPLDCWNKFFIPDEEAEKILDFICYGKMEIAKILEKN